MRVIFWLILDGFCISINKKQHLIYNILHRVLTIAFHNLHWMYLCLLIVINIIYILHNMRFWHYFQWVWFNIIYIDKYYATNKGRRCDVTFGTLQQVIEFTYEETLMSFLSLSNQFCPWVTVVLSIFSIRELILCRAVIFSITWAVINYHG